MRQQEINPQTLGSGTFRALPQSCNRRGPVAQGAPRFAQSQPDGGPARHNLCRLRKKIGGVSMVALSGASLTISKAAISQQIAGAAAGQAGMGGVDAYTPVRPGSSALATQGSSGLESALKSRALIFS